jgi:arginyl-tRNA synthetase
MYLKFEKQVRALLQKLTKEKEIPLEVPRDPRFGDLSSTICFDLAKRKKKDPKEIAESLVRKIRGRGLIEKVEAVEGYLNFFLNKPRFIRDVLNKVLRKKKNYGKVNSGRGKKVIVEHTSPNPIKPLHMGTARCAVLGDVTARVLRKANYKVEVQNYIDDLGRQVAILLLGIRKFFLPKKKGYKDDYWLGLNYVRASQALEENPQLEKEIEEIIKDLEEERGEYALLKEELIPIAVASLLETSWNLNIFYDLLVFERDIVASGLFDEALEKMLDTGKIYLVTRGEDEGCYVIDMSECKEVVGETLKPYKIIVRSDGTATYEGKDIAYHMWKFGLAKANLLFTSYCKQPNGEILYSTSSEGRKMGFGNASKVINVIGYEQKYSQLVVYHAMRVMGYEQAFKNSHHLHFKWVWLPGEEKFSGRKGTWVGFHLDAVLEKTFKLALKEVDKRNPKLSKKEKEKIARKIAVGAIRFFLTKFDLEKDILFEWDKVLDFEGETGPYIQYACVRAKKILEKVKFKPKINPSLLVKKEEIELVKKIADLPWVIQNSASNLRPNLIATYAYDLAKKFSEFYNACRVIQAESKELARARLPLVQASLITLQNCLDLLGIDVPKLM